MRQVVRAYSPYGFIYQPGSPDPEYLRIGNPQNPFMVDTVFRREAGRLNSSTASRKASRFAPAESS